MNTGAAMLDGGADPAEIKNEVLAYPSANPNTDAILTLGPVSAAPTILALDETGMAGDIRFGAFDLGAEIVKAVKAGTIKWGIGRQPFLHAYLPAAIVTDYHRAYCRATTSISARVS